MVIMANIEYHNNMRMNNQTLTLNESLSVYDNDNVLFSKI
jgi:hypothetical protein